MLSEIHDATSRWAHGGRCSRVQCTGAIVVVLVLVLVVVVVVVVAVGAGGRGVRCFSSSV